MDYKTFMRIRTLIFALITVIVFIAVITDNFYLAISGVFIGILSIFLVKSKFHDVIVDERVLSVTGKASRMTYAIVTFFLAMCGLFLIMSSRTRNDIYTESIGVLLCYVSMFSIAVYSISYNYFNKKYGGDK